jgi:hypothetical protein
MPEVKLKREEFVDDFLKIQRRILTRELPKEATNEEFIVVAYSSTYKRLRHIYERCQALRQPK